LDLPFEVFFELPLVFDFDWGFDFDLEAARGGAFRFGPDFFDLGRSGRGLTCDSTGVGLGMSCF